MIKRGRICQSQPHRSGGSSLCFPVLDLLSTGEEKRAREGVGWVGRPHRGTEKGRGAPFSPNLDPSLEGGRVRERGIECEKEEKEGEGERD